jgi:hypothetical protein
MDESYARELVEKYIVSARRYLSATWPRDAEFDGMSRAGEALTSHGQNELLSGLLLGEIERGCREADEQTYAVSGELLQLSMVLRKTAVLAHAPRIANLLLQPTILSDPYRSTRHHLLQTLEVIGTIECLPALSKFRTKVDLIPYQDPTFRNEGPTAAACRVFDNDEIDLAIKLITERSQLRKQTDA